MISKCETIPFLPQLAFMLDAEPEDSDFNKSAESPAETAWHTADSTIFHDD